ncbi:MAG: hypothetical protein IPJ32_15820 [Sphingobacteriaceae bacterium]|nr:hypothetical protein [Sphingobacteriaceae bacterium]
MCGIAGIYFFKNSGAPPTTENNKVTEALKHRGPDFQSHHAFKNCTLFHARLSILDLSPNSNQPFLDSAQEKALVFNGELFNYKDLQKEVGDLKTTGDVEVLFKLFDKEKTNCLNKTQWFFCIFFL